MNIPPGNGDLQTATLLELERDQEALHVHCVWACDLCPLPFECALPDQQTVGVWLWCAVFAFVLFADTDSVRLRVSSLGPMRSLARGSCVSKF